MHITQKMANRMLLDHSVRPSTIRRILVKAYYRSLRFLCPGLRNSQFAYREMLEDLVTPHTRWLDLGCGHQFFPEWMPDSKQMQVQLLGRAAYAVGIDPVDYRPHVAGLHKIAATVEQLPFPDNSFSLITANMVVEHVTDPRRLLSEVRRVLTPGGLFAFHTPNARYFEVAIARLLPSAIKKWFASLLDGRAADDVFSTHYRLNTVSAIKKAALKSGLVARSIDPVECTAQAVMLGPLVVIELAIIRMLRLSIFQSWRSDLLVILSKFPESSPEYSAGTMHAKEFSN